MSGEWDEIKNREVSVDGELLYLIYMMAHHWSKGSEKHPEILSEQSRKVKEWVIEHYDN